MQASLQVIFAVAIGIRICAPINAAEIKKPRDSQATNPIADVARNPTEIAVFAGGCFWCTEFAFEQLAGIVNVESGYCGGTPATANYGMVHRGVTGHAEAIRVTYDPAIITYDDLLDVFFDSHDPTQLNRQGKHDVGPQYRSAIFFADDEQKKQAEAKIANLAAKRVHKRRIMTRLEQLSAFHPAENYHQDFARRNPFLPYIQSHAAPKAMLVRKKHPELMRQVSPARSNETGGRE